MVRYVSDRIVVMYLGALVEIGQADDVFFHPKHPYTRLLIASNPEADPEYERKHAHVPIKGEIPSPINIPPGCRFAGRCPDVMEKCHTVTPEVIMMNDSHGAACLLYD